VGACGDDDDDSGGAAGEPDDDAAVDDDADDDNDTADDDNDDDASPDDDDNDDQSPIECPSGFLSSDGVCIERIVGGAPGDGTAVAVTAAGLIDLAAVMGRDLLLYKIDPTEDPLAPDVSVIDLMAAQPSAALDSADRLRVGYLDTWTDRVKFAAHDGTGWNIETISPEGHEIWYVAAAVDRHDANHVAYADATDRTLVYGTDASGVWTDETLLSLEGQVGPVGVAVDAQGVVSIAVASTQPGDAARQDAAKAYVTKVVYATNAGGQWAFATSSYNAVWAQLALTVDGAGAAHLALVLTGETAGPLKYLTNAGGEWQSETVYTGVSPFNGTALAVDDAGSPHVLFAPTGGLSALFLGTKTGGQWSFEALDAHGFTGMAPAIALDAGDRARVSFANETQLRLTVEGDGGWDNHVIDVSRSVDYATALAVDGYGASHVVFSDGVTTALHYASNATGAWAVENLPGPPNCDGSIAIDGEGRPNVATCVDGGLVRLIKQDIRWEVETIDGAGVLTGWDASLRFDPAGAAHISYFYENGDDYQLRYASNAGGAWAVETLATMSTHGEFFDSLAVDAAGAAHLAYFWVPSSGAYGLLRYATNRSGSWVYEDAATGVWTGEYCSIALDAAGNPHIAYYNFSNGQSSEDYSLKHAWKQDGEWLTEVVDSARLTGYFTSIAVDQSDAAHISYQDSANSDLRYASNASGAWQLRLIDPAGWSGLYTSLALYGDEARISYMADHSLYQASFQRDGAASRQSVGETKDETAGGN
jgi:hypothetical protein